MTNTSFLFDVNHYYIFVFSYVAKAAINPPLTERLGQLLTSEISLETDGFIG